MATQEDVDALRCRIAQIDGHTRLFRTFSGTECETVEEWAEALRNHALALQLTANQLVLQLPELLLGYPKEIFRDLSPDEKGDFNTVIRRISEKLKAPDRREQRRRDLYALKQKRHECILAYAGRARQYEFDSRSPAPVRGIGDGAQAIYDAAMHVYKAGCDAQLRGAFLNGIKKKIRRRIQKRDRMPATFDDLLEVARKVELTLKSASDNSDSSDEDEKFAPSNARVLSTQAGASASSTATLDSAVLQRLETLELLLTKQCAVSAVHAQPQQSNSNTDRLAQLERENAELRAAAQRSDQPKKDSNRSFNRGGYRRNRGGYGNNGNRNPNRFTVDGQPICNYCNRPGHMRVECRQFARERGQSQQTFVPHANHGATAQVAPVSTRVVHSSAPLQYAAQPFTPQVAAPGPTPVAGQAYFFDPETNGFYTQPQQPIATRTNRQVKVTPCEEPAQNPTSQSDDETDEEYPHLTTLFTQSSTTVQTASGTSQTTRTAAPVPPHRARQGASRLWTVGTFLLCLLTIASSQRPMICQTTHGKVMYQLADFPPCRFQATSAEAKEQPLALTLLKRNVVQYKTTAVQCKRITQSIRVFTYFLGAHLKEESPLISEVVGYDECMRMKTLHTSNDGPLTQTGSMWQTNNKLDWKYPPGGAWCCYWETFTVTNSFMLETIVLKRHASPEMECPAGDVSHCTYKDGRCQLQDLSFLIWSVDRIEKCEFVHWMNLPGRKLGNNWIANDYSLALTWSKHVTTDAPCIGSDPIDLSDQGIASRPRFGNWPLRPKRELSTGIVTSDLLAAELQALHQRDNENTQHMFAMTFMKTCSALQATAMHQRAQIQQNPILPMRKALNRTNIYARGSSATIETWPCFELEAQQFEFQPMGKRCTKEIPIRVNINGSAVDAFMDPLTNIVSRAATPADCALAQEVPFELDGKTFLYSGSNGAHRLAPPLLRLQLFHTNMSAEVPLESTIYHEVAMYNWTDFQPIASMNDLMNAIDHQQLIFRELGANFQNPQVDARQVASGVFQHGFLGVFDGFGWHMLL